MKRILSIILIFMILISTTGTVTAKDPTVVSIECNGQEIKGDIEPVVEHYNNNTDQIPSIIKPFIRSNTTDFSIENSSIQNYTVQTNEKLQITNIDTDKPGNPDLLVYTNETVVCNVLESNKPLEKFNKAYNNDKIEIEGKNLKNKIRIFVIDIINDITGQII